MPKTPSDSTATPKKFYPPQPKPWFLRFVQALSSAIARYGYKLELEVAPEDVKRLRALKQERLVLFPNHPTFREPVLLYVLSDRARLPFYYLAAYELFLSPMGKIFQAIGVYSIRRGLVDRASIKCTVDLLRQPQTRLVVFAEGRCSFQSDRVMPFQSGGVQLAFQAMAKEAKQTGGPSDLYAVPIAICYRYKSIAAKDAVEQTLVELETALELSPAGLDQYQRLRAIAERVISQIEADYPDLLTPAAGDNGAEGEASDSWNGRIQTLRTQVLAYCETQLGLSINDKQPVRDRAYRIQATLRDLTEATEIPTSPDIPVEMIQKSVERLLNLDAIYDGYVAENPTPERFLDTLARFQREVFGFDEPPPKGIRIATLKVGDPINLKDWFEEFQQDRNGTVEKATRTIQAAVQTKLDELIAARKA